MAKTSRGHIQRLPSGSFRVKVYAGTDPVTGKERLFRQTCPDEASAAAALGRLLAEADGGRFPDQHATLGQALGKYLEVADLEVSRLRRYADRLGLGARSADTCARTRTQQRSRSVAYSGAVPAIGSSTSSVVINLGTGARVPISQFWMPVLVKHEADRLQEQRVVVLRRRRHVGDRGSADAVTDREPQVMPGDQLLRGGVLVPRQRDDRDIYRGERGERVDGWSSILSVMLAAVRGAADRPARTIACRA